MSVHLWQQIFETAPKEEIKKILQETDLPIPGFRADINKAVPPKPLIVKALIYTINSKQKRSKLYAQKIYDAYEKLISNDIEQSLQDEDILRRKIIKLVLSGEPTSIREAETLCSQLIEQTDQNKGNVVKDIENDNTNNNLQEELVEQYKKNERELKKKLQNLEQKYETKVKEVNEMKKKCNVLTKKHTEEICVENTKTQKITEENIMLKQRIEELHKKTHKLESEITQKDNQLQTLQRQVDLNKTENDQYQRNLDNSNLIHINKNYLVTKHEENDDYLNRKTTLLIIGEKIQINENLKNVNLEFIHAQKISDEELEERVTLAESAILLSWTMTMPMQRKIRRIVPEHKLREFYDYNNFRIFINEEERMSYARV